jgi:hypothetical protein
VVVSELPVDPGSNRQRNCRPLLDRATTRATFSGSSTGIEAPITLPRPSCSPTAPAAIVAHQFVDDAGRDAGLL